jgi:hypothetical protein
MIVVCGYVLQVCHSERSVQQLQRLNSSRAMMLPTAAHHSSVCVDAVSNRVHACFATLARTLPARSSAGSAGADAQGISQGFLA